MTISAKEPVFNIPNILTMMRIAAIPILAVILMSPCRTAGFWAAALFSLAAITDWLDGYLARKMQIITVFGKFLDPIADKMIVMAALIMILPYNRVPAWMVLVILGREIIITGLRGIASNDGIVIAASNLGKFKTIFQLVAIIGLLLHFEYNWFFGIWHPLLQVNMHNVGMFFLWVSTLLSVWSGIDYLSKFVKIITR